MLFLHGGVIIHPLELDRALKPIGSSRGWKAINKNITRFAKFHIFTCANPNGNINRRSCYLPLQWVNNHEEEGSICGSSGKNRRTHVVKRVLFKRSTAGKWNSHNLFLPRFDIKNGVKGQRSSVPRRPTATKRHPRHLQSSSMHRSTKGLNHDFHISSPPLKRKSNITSSRKHSNWIGSSRTSCFHC